MLAGSPQAPEAHFAECDRERGRGGVTAKPREQPRPARPISRLELSDSGHVILGYQPRPDDPFACGATLLRIAPLVGLNSQAGLDTPRACA